MSDAENAVVDWFGDGFARLHPLLQALHRRGGRLAGNVRLAYGRGAAGGRMLGATAIGRRLARRLGLPPAGDHRLEVEIRHDAHTLWWIRRFDGTHTLQSSFQPQGRWPDGHWIERTGAFEFLLGVDVVEGAWHWRPRRVRVSGIRVPLWLIPQATAYKRIEGDRYRFHVGFALPVIGELLSYDGVLDLIDSPSRQPVA